jgi:tryptophanyl-tRNA synthetase
MLAPVRDRYADLRADERALDAILAAGAQRAKAIAAATLADVRQCVGVGALSAAPSAAIGTVGR